MKSNPWITEVEIIKQQTGTVSVWLFSCGASPCVCA